MKERKAQGLEALGALVFNDENYKPAEEPEEEKLPKGMAKQQLIVSRSKKGRGGKVATLVSGFNAEESDIEALAYRLKTKLGTGGSVVDGEILIQGEAREKVTNFLRAEGHTAKISG